MKTLTKIFKILPFFLLSFYYSFSQTICETYMDAGPINRTTGYGEEHIAPGFYQALAQRYNNLSGTMESVVFWGRANTSSITVKVRIYNEQTGSGLPGVILRETTVTLPADTVHNLVTVSISPSLTLTSPNVTILSIEPFFTTDDFFVQHNQPGDGQNLWLNLVKQSNTWYKNLANGDPSWDYDFLILPMKTSTITSNFSFITDNLDVDFTNSSTNASSYYWDFGDSVTSSLFSPSHTFTGDGTYLVTLYARSADTTCFDSTTQSVTVTSCIAPTADFNYSGSLLTVNFSDSSSEATSWSWSFGDGANSTLQNPSHTYDIEDTYMVCLVVTNSCGTDTICNFVMVSCPLPLPGFDYSDTMLTVIFSDLSTGATSWLWDFGDGNISTQQNPSHTYDTDGTYTVCLAATNSCGSDSSCQIITVTSVGIEEMKIQRKDELLIHYAQGSNLLIFESSFDEIVNLYNILGVLIDSQELKKDETEYFDIEHLKPGIFFISTVSNMKTYKFIKF